MQRCQWVEVVPRVRTVISGETGATYTVVSADVGNRIRVEATFTDANGGAAETRSFTSPHPVQAFRRAADNPAPVFSPTDVTRRVEENSTGNVGGPVTATDADGDKLTYTISGDERYFRLSMGATVDRFTIDAATGQLMAAVKLNYRPRLPGMTVSYMVKSLPDSSGVAPVPLTPR